jgi:ATP-dependent Clp protease ATP-binding subunit ClpA
VFERFDEGARQAVVHAQDAARGLHHNYIGTEHLLLGLLDDAGAVSTEVLGSFAVTDETVRTRLVQIIGVGDEPSPERIPFTPRAKKALELGLREALSLCHSEIRSGHLVLGLLRVEEGVAFRILLDLDVPLDKLRQRMIDRLGEPDPAVIQGPSRPEIELRLRRVEPAGEVDITVRPDPELRRLLMAAGGHALTEGRELFGLADLLAVAPGIRKADSQSAPEAPETGT